jgi:hypothetical protein
MLRVFDHDNGRSQIVGQLAECASDVATARIRCIDVAL